MMSVLFDNWCKGIRFRCGISLTLYVLIFKFGATLTENSLKALAGLSFDVLAADSSIKRSLEKTKLDKVFVTSNKFRYYWLFHILAQFPFTASERELNYYHKKMKLPHELPNNLRLEILEN